MSTQCRGKTLLPALLRQELNKHCCQITGTHFYPLEQPRKCVKFCCALLHADWSKVMIKSAIRQAVLILQRTRLWLLMGTEQ